MNNRVIINSDDFGITEGVNKAIIELVEAGIMTSTSVMTNMPFFRKLDSIKDKIGVGIHLTLTEGNPIVDPEKIPSLVDDNGNFYPINELTRRTFAFKVSKKDIEKELNAQILRLFDSGVIPSHMDSHESFMKHPLLVPVLKKLALKHGIKGVRTYKRRLDIHRLINPKRLFISAVLYQHKLMWKKAGFRVTDRIDSLNKHSQNLHSAIAKLKDIFENLHGGVLELVVHPGYCSGDTSPLGDYVDQREVELKALLSNEMRNFIEQAGVKLINYNEI